MGINGAATRSCNDDVGPKAFSHIAVIGGGAWGTALALTAHRAGRRVTLWARESAVVEAVARPKRHPPARAMRRQGQGRAPGAAADDGDM